MKSLNLGILGVFCIPSNIFLSTPSLQCAPAATILNSWLRNGVSTEPA